MSPWFLIDGSRLTSERVAISALNERVSWLKGLTWTLSEGRLSVQVEIEVGEVDFPVVLEYPALFPASPPSVTPRDKNEIWSSHQYLASGELCLEWGSDNWEPHVTGADLLESAHKLLSTEKPGGETRRRDVASRHEISPGQDLRSRGYGRVAVSDECRRFLSELPEQAVGTFEFLFVGGDGSLTVHIQSIDPDDGEPWNAPALPKTVLRAGGRVLKGRFVRTPLAGPKFFGSSVEDLRSSLSECGCTEALAPVAGDQEAVILLLQGSPLDVRAVWLPTKEGDDLFWLRSFQLTRQDCSRTGGNESVISSKRVGIVGLGSAGSKIAVTLARSGVRDFVLIDDDIFLPGNIERHSLDFRNVGEHKVNGVKAQLEALTSDIKVEVSRLRLSGQEASSRVSHMLTQLSECDVVVDATANPRTFNVLAETVRQARKPIVWLEVFAGGIGGVVARSRPGKDPDPFTVRALLHSHLEDQAPAPRAAAGSYAGVGIDGEPLIATDAEVGIIAHHAARLAFDLIEAREPSGFPHSIYLIGLEQSWIFEAPFHTIPIDVGGPMDSSKGSEGPLSEDNIEFLKHVIKPGLDASED